MVLVRFWKQCVCHGGDHGGGWSFLYQNRLWWGELGGVGVGHGPFGLGGGGDGGGSVAGSMGGSEGGEEKIAGGRHDGLCGGDSVNGSTDVGGGDGDGVGRGGECGVSFGRKSGGGIFTGAGTDGSERKNFGVRVGLWLCGGIGFIGFGPLDVGGWRGGGAECLSCGGGVYDGGGAAHDSVFAGASGGGKGADDRVGLAGGVEDGAGVARIAAVTAGVGGGVDGAECGGGVCLNLCDAGDRFYVGGYGEVICGVAGGGGGGGVGDGAVAGSKWGEASVAVGAGVVGGGKCGGVVESVGRVVLPGGGRCGSGDGLVTIGGEGSGGGANAERAGGGAVWDLGFCGEVGRDGRAVSVWRRGGVIRNAWGDFAQWGLVFAGGSTFGAGKVGEWETCRGVRGIV